VETGDAGGMAFSQGTLDVGQAMATPIIHALREEIDKERLTLIDAPPGTGCPTIAALQAADFALLVTEPTPFGLHDLRAAIEVARSLDQFIGVVINRDGIGDGAVEAFCRTEEIPVLMRIPFQRDIAAAYAVGRPLVDAGGHWKERFVALFRAIVEERS
jgi:MinD superfamily P-loop ATPase